MLEIKDKQDTVDTSATDEPKATEVKSDAKTFQCNIGDHEVKLGFNFRESRSKKADDGSYTNYEFWYRNICKPCGQQLLLNAQK